MTLKGHYDGKGITLDEVPPADLIPNTPVTVLIERSERVEREVNALEQIAAMAIDNDGLPPDYASQLKHYLYGHPKQ